MVGGTASTSSVVPSPRARVRVDGRRQTSSPIAHSGPKARSIRVSSPTRGQPRSRGSPALADICADRLCVHLRIGGGLDPPPGPRRPSQLAVLAMRPCASDLDGARRAPPGKLPESISLRIGVTTVPLRQMASELGSAEKVGLFRRGSLVAPFHTGPPGPLWTPRQDREEEGRSVGHVPAALAPDAERPRGQTPGAGEHRFG